MDRTTDNWAAVNTADTTITGIRRNELDPPPAAPQEYYNQIFCNASDLFHCDRPNSALKKIELALTVYTLQQPENVRVEMLVMLKHGVEVALDKSEDEVRHELQRLAVKMELTIVDRNLDESERLERARELRKIAYGLYNFRARPNLFDMRRFDAAYEMVGGLC